MRISKKMMGIVIMYFCILQRYFSSDSKIPVLIVGNKADMNAVRQDYILQPEAFCAKHRVSIFRY